MTSSTPVRMAEYIAALHDDDSAERKRARQALVAMGSRAVPALQDLLFDPSFHTRWEAATALLDLGAPPSSAPALVSAMDDEQISVRWIAAKALIKCGERSLPWVLQGLIERSESPNFRESAERALRHLARGKAAAHADAIDPVLNALDGQAPAEESPGVAAAALETLRGRGLKAELEPEEGLEAA